MLSERVHVMDMNTNDFFVKGTTSDKKLIELADIVIASWNPAELVDVLRMLWQYKSDSIIWDVPTHPLIVLGTPVGDCDDYARLAAYILHKGGYETYYIALAKEDSRIGHAICIYLDEQARTLYLVDVNERSALALPAWEPQSKYVINGTEICELVRKTYPEYDYVSVRDWSAKELLYFRKIRR
jgi:hypothetical protein